MNKAFWVGLGIMILCIIGIISVIFYSFWKGAVDMTRNFHENVTETLNQSGALNTTIGQDALNFINQGFSILYSIYRWLLIVFIIAVVMFVVEIIIWYAARRL